MKIDLILIVIIILLFCPFHVILELPNLKYKFTPELVPIIVELKFKSVNWFIINDDVVDVFIIVTGQYCIVFHILLSKEYCIFMFFFYYD